MSNENIVRMSDIAPLLRTLASDTTCPIHIAAEIDQIVEQAPTLEAIPISVMKREITCISAADQCDQAGRYDFELREALKTILRWYATPRYKEVEMRVTDGK